MTSTAALSVNTAVTASASAATAAPTAQNGFGSNARADFRKPLQQARQQHQQHQQSSQASRQAPASRDATASAKPASTAHHASSNDAHDQDDNEQATSSATTPDAATAMLALLGQSIPAQAAATPAPVATGQGDASSTVATLPAALQAMAGLQGQGLMQPGTQADADDMLDSKSVDALKDDALSTASAPTEEGDDTTTAFTDVLSAMAKASGTGQASQTSSSDHSHSLDALNSLMTSSLPQSQANSPAAPTAHALTMQSSVGTPAFAQELGQQVAWLGGQDVKEARIRLHPEDLGPLDVKVSVKQDHVDVGFIAQHPQAVHAVQQTLGQLDTLLAHHGLSLGHAEVGQGGRGNESGQGTSSSGTNSGAGDSSTESGGIAAVAAPVIKAIGLLDTFA